MDTAINLLRREMGAGFKEVNARIDTLRSETADNFRLVEADAKIEQSRKESLERLDALRADAQQRRDRSDIQFRWMVGLVVAGVVALVGWLSKAQFTEGKVVPVYFPTAGAGSSRPREALMSRSM